MHAKNKNVCDVTHYIYTPYHCHSRTFSDHLPPLEHGILYGQPSPIAKYQHLNSNKKVVNNKNI